MTFSDIILNWYDENKRNLPWRITKDPYQIWLSEIIMQQTQIIQGTDYYLRFIKDFPTVFDLAKASEQDVLLIWQGLGYYSRARNLHKTANEIVKKYNGLFPDNYKALIALKGIGDYTASAISSVCFNKPHPAIDGNVMRLISRLFEIREPINKTIGKQKIKEITNRLISENRPGDFNQAMMDFGSQICKSTNPYCEDCIFKDECKAFQNDNVLNLPYKEKPKPKTKAFFYYVVCFDETESNILITKRIEGIWKNLYEFPKIISTKKLTKKSVIENFKETYKINHKITLTDTIAQIKHTLSHKELYIQFYGLKLNAREDLKSIFRDESYVLAEVNNLTKFPFPIVLQKYIEHNILN